MTGDQEFCHRCKQVTTWEPIRGGTRLRCTGGCKDVFPCKHACQHLDCAEARKTGDAAAAFGGDHAGSLQ